MQSTFEELGGTYRQEGGYLLPNVEAPESPAIGIWGQRRLQYLRTNKNVLYMTMLMRGKLKDHLEEVDKSAEEMFEQMLLSTINNSYLYICADNVKIKQICNSLR